MSAASAEDLTQMAAQLRIEIRAQGAEAVRHFDSTVKSSVDREFAPMRLEFSQWQDVIKNDRDQFRGEVNVAQGRLLQDVERFYKEFETQKEEVVKFYQLYIQRCSAIEQYVGTMEANQNVPADIRQTMATFNSRFCFKNPMNPSEHLKEILPPERPLAASMRTWPFLSVSSSPIAK